MNTKALLNVSYIVFIVAHIELNKEEMVLFWTL